MKKAVIILFLGAVGGWAQSPGGGPAHLELIENLEAGPISLTTVLAGPVPIVTGAPYSAQSSTERVQVLADGNRLIHNTSGSIARDSRGRIRRDEAIAGLKSDDSDASHIVTIDDPVAQVHWTLDSRTKAASKLPLPSLKPGAPGSAHNVFFGAAAGPIPPGMGDGPSTIAFSRSIAPSLDGANTQHQDLGTKSVEGVAARGTRIIRTIPAGQAGNEMPLVISTETWYSPDLKVLVMSKSSDPRMGDTVYSLTAIQRAEPPASLFEIPPDYTVKEMGPLPPLPPLAPLPPTPKD